MSRAHKRLVVHWPHDDDGRPLHRTDQRQEAPLALHVSLTTLQGLTYPLRGVKGREITATTYVDWGTFELRPGGGGDQLVEPAGRAPLDFVLASAANPGAFAPRMLDRTADEAAYRENGIESFPASGCLWYTDGGLVASEPVGRTLAAARGVAGDGVGYRLHLVVDPRSEGPSGSSRWSDEAAPPSWTAGIARALSILPAQALYDDLRRAAARNDRLTAVDEAAGRLGPVLGDRARAAVAEIAGGAAEEDDVDLVRRMLLKLSGLEGKQRVHFELISPLLLAEGNEREVPGLLAGEFLATFGGFLSERIRESDYVLGWASTRAWLMGGLQRAGVDTAAVDEAVAAVDLVRDPDWRAVNLGLRHADALTFAERRSLARLALHVGRVLLSGAVGSCRGGTRHR